MEDSNSNTQPARKKSRRRKILALVATIAVLGYLAMVLLTDFKKATSVYPNGFDPVIFERCKPIYREMALTPYADEKFAQFREYGNIWLLDSAKTSMLRVELLNYPECFAEEVKASIRFKERHIIVLFDVEKNREVLVITNR